MPRVQATKYVRVSELIAETMRPILTAALAACALIATEAFSPSAPSGVDVVRHRSAPAAQFTALSASPGDDDDKFSFAQRIDSAKCAVVGAVAGGVALTPFAAFHDILYSDSLTTNGVAQWEFDTGKFTSRHVLHIHC